jgi:dCMP deaminase
MAKGLNPSQYSRPDIDNYFLQMLDLVASRSTCGRRAVAAIITDVESHVLSMGYNGVPSGFDHCTEKPCAGRDEPHGGSAGDKCLAVHAEANAILQCQRLDLASTLYCSCSPCFTCAKLIANTRISRVVYREEYPDHGLLVLSKAGIRLELK